MQYFFIKRATTKFGPINFAVYILPGQTIAMAVAAEGLNRNVIICHDWTAEPITQKQCEELIA